jgi:hypothetical protein
MIMAGHYLKLFEANIWWEVGGLEHVDAWHTLSSAPLVGNHTVPVKEHTLRVYCSRIHRSWLGRKSQLRHRVVVPARQATLASGPVWQPYAGVDFIPQSWIYEIGYCNHGPKILEIWRGAWKVEGTNIIVADCSELFCCTLLGKKFKKRSGGP